MRKFPAVLLLLSLMFLTTLASSATAQTRQRRVSESAPTNAPESNAPQTNTSRPPVLKGTGTTNNRQQAPQERRTQSDEAEEIGEDEVLRVNTTLVTVPVTVSDSNGRYVPNLRQQDFRIYENGQEQEVAYFASVEKPFTVALVIDTSNSTRFRLNEIQDAAIAFVNQLRADDRVLVVSFDDHVRVLAEATNNRYTLRDAIRSTRTGDGTSLYDAVDFVINQRFNRLDGRKAVVLFTDGVDTTSRRATYEGNIHDAEELDALIYPVQYDTYNDMNRPTQQPYPRRGQSRTDTIVDILGGILGGGRIGGGGGGRGGGGGGGAGTGRMEYERASAYLRDLANKTGARLHRADSTRDLTQAFTLIAEELRRQYSIGYYPKTVAQAGERRQIRVRVNQPGLVARARDSYISNLAASSAGQFR